MQFSIHNILKKYWGYDSFRPKQENIINSVLTKKDTIALLPTGGGKSLCYQVPGMVIEGLTIVISPLIALMNDQVENLNSKNIRAIALTSELSEKEMDLELDKCVNGETKFLYISPEKLKNHLVKTRIPLMNVALLAVDEAHCISQWGHDFRPSYLEISTIRDLIPETPILALTATATNIVLKDISKYLNLEKSEVFQTSFKRDNLAFWVLKEEDKFYRLFQILNKVKGSTVIYVRNRRKTKEISSILNKHGIKSTFYHAGLEKDQKNKRQLQWMKGEVRAIVATNAFGMGIDKPDVRLVVHMDLPDSPEAYFQEAGRAGRDTKKAFAIMLFNDSDVENLKSFHLNNLADKEIVSDILSRLYKNYKIAKNNEDYNLYPFNLPEFVFKNQLNFIKTYNAINILQKEDVISVTNTSSIYSKIMFVVGNDYLFQYKDKNEYLGIFITLLLRSYGGLSDDYVKINEYNFASKNNISQQLVRNNLLRLKKDGIIKYEPSQKGQKIKFLLPRNEKYIIGSISKSIETRNERLKNRIKAIINYAENSKECRNHQMLQYFDQKKGKECGLCDVCVSKKEKQIYSINIEKEIINLLKKDNFSSREIVGFLKKDDKLILNTISYLLETNVIEIKSNNKYSLKEYR
ncbi:MAG: ATP-dependent DNA helicase RecQ [Bacteroidota bacterium]